MAAPPVPSPQDGSAAFSTGMRAFHEWEANTLEPALNAFFDSRLLSTSTVSTTSITIDTNTPKTFTVETGKGFLPGMFIVAANTASPGNYIAGQVQSYSGSTLVMTNTSRGGTGTFTAWTISQAVAGGGAGLGSNTFTGVQKFAHATDIASAATVNLSTATGNTARITGTTATSAFTIDAGQWMELVAVAAWPLTYNATTCRIRGGRNYTCAAGDRIFVLKDNTGIVYVDIRPADGSELNPKNKLESITATVSTGALTITFNGGLLDFRSPTLTTGTPLTLNVASNDIVIPSTSSLGTTTATSARIAVLEAYNGGTPVICAVNVSGNLLLDETNLISPTNVGASSNSAAAIYSDTTVSSNSSYRVIGFVDAVWTSGSGWSTPTLVQGIGGQTTVSQKVQQSATVTLSGTTTTLATSIPSTAKVIFIQIAGMSTSGTSIPILRLGVGGTAETTSYNGSGSTGTSVSNGTTGASLGGTHTAAYVKHGMITLSKMEGSNTWAVQGVLGHSEAAQFSTVGYTKALAGTLDSLFMTTVNGTDTYDGGTVSVSWL